MWLYSLVVEGYGAKNLVDSQRLDMLGILLPFSNLAMGRGSKFTSWHSRSSMHSNVVARLRAAKRQWNWSVTSHSEQT